MDKSAHYFWAVQIPKDIKRSIQEEIAIRKEVFPFKRWVHMNDYHITLAFLGAVDEQKLNLMIEQVGNAIKDETAFKLQIHGINIFGNKKSPRIFWGAVNHERSLFELQAIVNKKCQEIGFSLDSRPYQPHITLAKNWIGEDEFDMEILEKYNPFYENPLTFLADKIVLYRTNLEKIPKYEPIEIFSLGYKMDH